MQEFYAYLKMGFFHITDLNGYDHILFIMSLCAVYQWRDWRRVLWLVTAFTIGHSVTLALATFQVVRLPKAFIEFLIPLTIIATAVGNVFSKVREAQDEPSTQTGYVRYLFALLFGLIHGLGFSNFLRDMLMRSTIFVPLLGFNVGLEVGQILVVMLTLSIASGALFLAKTRLKMRDWCNFLSGATAGIGLVLLLNTDFWKKNILGKRDEVAENIDSRRRS